MYEWRYEISGDVLYLRFMKTLPLKNVEYILNTEPKYVLDNVQLQQQTKSELHL